VRKLYQPNMKRISVHLPADVIEATHEVANAMGLPPAAYIRMAVERMNQVEEALGQAERMAQASRRCRRESLRVNAEFSTMERDLVGLTRAI